MATAWSQKYKYAWGTLHHILDLAYAKPRWQVEATDTCVCIRLSVKPFLEPGAKAGQSGSLWLWVWKHERQCRAARNSSSQTVVPPVATWGLDPKVRQSLSVHMLKLPTLSMLAAPLSLLYEDEFLWNTSIWILDLWAWPDGYPGAVCWSRSPSARPHICQLKWTSTPCFCYWWHLKYYIYLFFIFYFYTVYTITVTHFCSPLSSCSFCCSLVWLCVLDDLNEVNISLIHKVCSDVPNTAHADRKCMCICV